MRYVLWILFASLLIGCGVQGDVFFVRNYSKNPVTLEYRYHAIPEWQDTFDYHPPDTAMASQRILKRKEYYPFWKLPYVYYDYSVPVTRVDSFNYRVTIPGNSTVRLGPIYQFGDNISQVIIDKADTLHTNKDEFLYYHKALHKFEYNPKLVGDSYFLLDLFSPEIKEGY